jgi:hypothetical protein
MLAVKSIEMVLPRLNQAKHVTESVATFIKPSPLQQYLTARLKHRDHTLKPLYLLDLKNYSYA